MTERTPSNSTRRTLLQGMAALAPVAAVVGAAQAETRVAQQKLPQAMIMYQPTPKDGLRCDACLHWQPPNACAIVEGPIAPAGWCGAFAPKQG